jgi:hypothetical protein
LIALLVSLLFLLVLASNFSISKIDPLWWLVIILILGAISLAWWLTNRIPRTPKGKVGFLVAIVQEDESKQQKFKNDFIRVLNELLQGGNLRYQFRFIELNQFHSAKILDPETANYYLKLSRGHFLIYGRIRERPLNNQPHHFLNLFGLVSHRPIALEVSKALSKEFGELLPKRLAISSEGDVFAFEFTAQLVDLVARYIIGTASLMSGDFQYATDLFEDLRTRIASFKEDFPAIAKMKMRVPDRLFQTYSTRAFGLYDIWISTREKLLMERMETLIKRALEIRPEDYSCLLLEAICCFVLRRDVKAAKRNIKNCQHNKDGTWLYSYAFLFAYEGNMRSAKKLYMKAFKRPVGMANVPLQTEQFIMDTLSAEPEKIQLHFCLALLNYYGKQDYLAAEQDLNRFLAARPADRFADEKEDAHGILNKIVEMKQAHEASS